MGLTAPLYFLRNKGIYQCFNKNWQTPVLSVSLISVQMHTHQSLLPRRENIKKFQQIFREGGKEVKKVNLYKIIRVWRGSNPRPMD